MEGLFYIPWLSLLIFLPLVGAVLLLFVPREREDWIKGFTLGVTLFEFLISLVVFLKFEDTRPGMQFVEKVPWIPEWGAQYFVGIDGISLLLVVLTTHLMPISILSSWSSVQKGLKEYMVAFLLMETAMIGTFSALDLVLFYLFWEGMLIPMYLLIAVWGGPRRDYASLKFFIYTLVGSVFLLLGIIALYFKQGTFFIPEVLFRPYEERFQLLVFLAFATAFAIKVPMFPFHTWLPAAHVEAPTAGSVFLASILLKMGSYGFLRFCLGITPKASLTMAPWILMLSIIAIIYAGFLCLGQEDMKRLIAYSSVSHMGFVTLGIFTFTLWGLKGAMLQMLNHGVTTGALFLCVGILYERTHSRLISDNSGLGKVMPLFVAFFGVFCFSSFAFPGTNNFVGELFVLLGAFEKDKTLGLFLLPGPVLAAAYMLRLLKRTVWKEGEVSPLWDLNAREVFYLLPLLVAVLWVGFCPGKLVEVMEPALMELLKNVKSMS